jgi:dTDP-D-glucose 4,6-dehydratase
VNKTFLITGGAGFIGSNFARHLYHKYPECKIIVLDALTYAGCIENLPVNINAENGDRLSFWYGNVKNGELVDTLVSQSDVVVHFAAETHVTRSIYDNYIFFETDVLGTQTVANAVLKYKNKVERFIHISTSEVYGTALIQQGLIKAHNFKNSHNKNAYLYYLTPRGFEVKARTTYFFLKRKMQEYEQLETEIRLLKEEAGESASPFHSFD